MGIVTAIHNNVEIFSLDIRVTNVPQNENSITNLTRILKFMVKAKLEENEIQLPAAKYMYCMSLKKGMDVNEVVEDAVNRLVEAGKQITSEIFKKHGKK